MAIFRSNMLHMCYTLFGCCCNSYATYVPQFIGYQGRAESSDPPSLRPPSFLPPGDTSFGKRYTSSREQAMTQKFVEQATHTVPLRSVAHNRLP